MLRAVIWVIVLSYSKHYYKRAGLDVQRNNNLNFVRMCQKHSYLYQIEMFLRKVGISTNRSDLCSPSAKFNWRIKYNFTLDQIDPSIKYFCIMMDTKNKFCITFQVSDERNRGLASTHSIYYYRAVSSYCCLSLN